MDVAAVCMSYRKVDFNRFIKKKPSYKFNTNALKDEYIHSNYIAKVDDRCSAIEDPKVGVKDCAKITSITKNAAKQRVPNVLKSVEAYMWDNDDTLSQMNYQHHNLDRNMFPRKHKMLSKNIKKHFTKMINLL